MPSEYRNTQTCGCGAPAVCLVEHAKGWTPACDRHYLEANDRAPGMWVSARSLPTSTAGEGGDRADLTDRTWRPDNIWYGPCDRCGTSHGGFPRTYMIGKTRCVEARSRRIAAGAERLAELAQEAGIDA